MTASLRTQLEEALRPAYEVERELGGGGMSRVYVAMETGLGRRVVIKVLSPVLTAGISRTRCTISRSTSRPATGPSGPFR